MNKIRKTLSIYLLCLAAHTAMAPHAKGQNLPNNTTPLSKVSIVAIGVTDLEKSVVFYRDVLGLQVTSQQSNIAMISADSITLMLSVPLGNYIKPGASSMEIVFPVDSVSATYRLLTDRGCSFAKTPSEFVPGSWSATLKDPDGHLLTVIGAK